MACAQDRLHAYAVVVGTNVGGPGQGTLSYAERDAERMASLLVELGRTSRDDVRLLKRPSVHEVELALADLRDRLREHAARGERTQVVFYYSGHARAHALSLGQEELSLKVLRTSLEALPSTLTLAVLDACQSGAFSGVKGATPAADFSVSSVNDLHSQGIAVMASSTAAELSQESSELGSSYFSHHLLVAMRGAGDSNMDGKVSLDEAYRYAYERTLSDTARTQVGSQHATLETELKGRGDVPLTYPLDADAQLVLPSALEGRVLIQREKRGVVMAELIKARAAPLLLALPRGRYDVLVRSASARDANLCHVELSHAQIYTLSLERCERVYFSEAQAKGPKAAREESWFLELGLSADLGMHDDSYVRTLNDFRFFENSTQRRGLDAFQLAAGYGLHRFVSVLARFDTLEYRSYQRNLQGPDGNTRDETFAWATRAASLGVRARIPLLREWVVAFAELDSGLGVSRTRMTGEHVHSTEHFFGPVLRGSAGLTFGIWKYLGAYLSAGYGYAPVLKNRVGDTHDGGGWIVASGIRVRGDKGGF